MKKRILALFTAGVMLFGAVVGGTVAWLSAKSSQVTNTFTVGDINITLDETNVEKSADTDPARDTANEYKMIPGQKYVKDPTVHVEKGSEPCYVFVKITESNNTLDNGKIIQYKINDGWVSVGDNVYMYGTDENTPTEINALNIATDYFDTSSVLATHDNSNTNITINSALTKEVLDKMEQGTIEKPELIFVACAIQSANIVVADAISQAKSILGVTTTP